MKKVQIFFVDLTAEVVSTFIIKTLKENKKEQFSQIQKGHIINLKLKGEESKEGQKSLRLMVWGKGPYFYLVAVAAAATCNL